MNKQQKGFTHVMLLLVVLIVVGVGFAGWKVWDNHKTPKTETAPQNTPSPSATTTPKLAPTMTIKEVVAPASVDLTLSYPSNWTVSHPEDYETKILGPDKDVYVYVHGGGGLGGYCDPEASGKFNTVEKYLLNNPKLSLVTTTSDVQYNGSESRRVDSRVVQTSDLDHFKVGKSDCDGYLNEVLSSRFFGESTAKDVNIINSIITIQSKKIGETCSQTGCMPLPRKTINNFLNSDDYKAAIAIVKTITY